MVVVGVSRHGRLRRLFAGTTGDRIASLAGSVDVHLVTHDQVAPQPRRRPALSPLSRRRQVAGWATAVVLPVVLTWVLQAFEETDQLPLAEMLLLAGTVLVALVGGLLPALVAAVISFFMLNYFFTPPVRTLTIAEPANLRRAAGVRRGGRRGRDRRRPGLTARRRRRCGPAPRPPP